MPGPVGRAGRDPFDVPVPVPETPASGTGTGTGTNRRATKLAKLPFGRGARITEIGPGKKKLPEPSGVAFHKGRGTIFVVGDRGHVAELTRDGEVVRKERVAKVDLEGVTIGPGGRVFAAVEEPPRILEIDPDTLEVLREFKVKAKLDGERVIGRHGNEGIEGLCWVAERRAFYVVNQARPPQILKLELPLDKRDGGKAEITDVIDLTGAIREEASDLAYDAATNHFLVAESGGDKRRGALHEVSLAGELVRSVGLPGKRPEGFALDDRGSAFIAQDDGGLLRVDP